MNILRKRTTDVEVKKHCITLLETMGSFAYTKKVLEDLDQNIRSEIKGYGGNEPLLKLLDDLKNWSTL
jgi:geranylgeranyl diphosphate synthase type 3